MKMRIASLSLLTVCCLVLAVAPAMAATLYDNGPYNGTTDAWTINFGFAVSNLWPCHGQTDCDVEGTVIVYWDASSTDVLTTVDQQLGTTSFGGTIQTLTGVTNTFLGTNQYGYNLFQASYSYFSDLVPAGANYVTLSNACTTSGCSVSNPIYWDENSGPTLAYENTIGSIPSEAFTLTGVQDEGTTPEPSGILLFGSGVVGLAGVLRRKLTS